VDIAISAPPEIIAAFREGRRSGSWIEAVCPHCGKGPRDRKLRAGIYRGRPWWGCMRCQCQKDYQASQRTAKLHMQYDREKASAEADAMRKWALDLVEKSSTIRSGDIVDRYLRDRGLRPSASFWPSTLRRARLYYKAKKKTYDAMLAIVQNVAGDTVACHRTFLFDLGECVVKASDKRVPSQWWLREAKLSAAEVTGHAIRLGVDAEEIGVAEGIESALGLAVHTRLVCWSAISANGMKELVIPKSIKRVVIGPDLGDNKDEGINAAYALRNRLRQRGIDVSLLIPPGRDWGEVG